MSQYNSGPISQLQPGAAVLATDIFPATDITDLSQSSSGTTKKYSVLQLQAYLLNEFNGDNLKSALYATTGNLTAAYDNGPNDDGVGATLVNTGALGQLTVDGFITISGDRILVASQTSSLQNGVYEVTDAGDVGTPWVLTRVTDFDGSTLGEIFQGMFIYVVFGSVNALTCWIVTSTSFPTVGTSPIVFQKQTNPITEAWVNVGSPTVQLAVNTGYSVQGGVTSTMTLPVLSAVGEFIEINASSPATFIIAQNAGQIIRFGGIGGTTIGVTGTLTNTLFFSAIKLRCIVANTEWMVVSSTGTFALA
jgi:hypothetical protein